MNRQHILSALGAWSLIAVLTILWGAFREAVFIPATGMNGTLARAILLPVPVGYVFFIAYRYLRNRKDFSRAGAVRLGAAWVLMTVAFEFVFGSLVMGNPVEVLLEDYNLLAGHTWPLFLIALGMSPYLAWRRVRLLQRK